MLLIEYKNIIKNIKFIKKYQNIKKMNKVDIIIDIMLKNICIFCIDNYED